MRLGAREHHLPWKGTSVCKKLSLECIQKKKFWALITSYYIEKPDNITEQLPGININLGYIE
jgi:hypothetical protein